jgi:hypothetical protein
MDNQAIIGRLKKVTGSYEVHHKTSFQCFRRAKDGSDQDVTVEIWDAGPDVNPNLRYTCVAKAVDGRSATGNPDFSIDAVLTHVHWSELDAETPKEGQGKEDQSMSADAKSEALSAIHDEAEKLLNRDDLPEEVEQGLERIIAIARYEHDVRSESEKLIG